MKTLKRMTLIALALALLVPALFAAPQEKVSLVDKMSEDMTQKTFDNWEFYLRNLFFAIEKSAKPGRNLYVSDACKVLLQLPAQEEESYVGIFQQLSAEFEKQLGDPCEYPFTDNLVAFYRDYRGPNKEYLLPTLAIWYTGTVETIIRISSLEPRYMDNPGLAAKAYEILSYAEQRTAQKVIPYALARLHHEFAETQLESVNNFLDEWEIYGSVYVRSIREVPVLKQEVEQRLNPEK